jgi:uncharacterized protein (DUF2147 family)
MKKIVFLTAVLFTSVASLLAQQPDHVKGTWLNENKDAKVEIYKSGDKYFGKITWTKDMYEADGKTLKKDSKNPDEKLRNRTIQNLVIITDLTYDDGEWSGGELYDPKSGKTYKSKLKLKGGSLEIRGYVGSPMFGKTTVWTRV